MKPVMLEVVPQEHDRFRQYILPEASTDSMPLNSEKASADGKKSLI